MSAARRVWGLGLLVWGLAPRSSAQSLPAPEAARTYSLTYVAPPTCPTEADLGSAIEARTTGAVSRAPDPAPVDLRVELGPDGAGTLWLRLPEGLSRRELAGARCADVVQSIALIAAMVLDADASQRAATARAFFEPSAEPEASGENAQAAGLVVPPPPPPSALPAPVARSESQSAKAGSPPPAERSARWSVSVSSGVLFESAVAAPAAWGGKLGLSLERVPRGSSFWAPSLQADLLGTLPRTRSAGAGDVELQLAAVRLQLCPVQWALVTAVRLQPCVTGDGGSLSARGTGTARNPELHHMPWWAFGAALRSRVGLRGGLSLESSASARRLIRADRFYFRPDFEGYQVPGWSLGVGLGLAYTLF